MNETIKVKFTGSTYNNLTRIIYEKMTELTSQLNHYTMALTATTGQGDVSTAETLKEISTASYGVSQLSTILHYMEESYASKKVKNVSKDLTLDLDKQTLALTRDLLAELIVEQSDKVANLTFKLQSFFKLVTPITGTTSTEVVNDLRDTSALLNEYSNSLSQIESALEKHFMATAERQAVKLN